MKRTPGSHNHHDQITADGRAGVPAIVTDKGEHITLQSKNSNELEIMIRPGEEGEWKGTGSKFVSNEQLYGDYQLRMASGRFTLVYHSEVYMLK